MPFVSDDLLNDICMSNDIIDYASSFMTIKKNGKNYMACCPFHNEKTPSFSINRDKQLFHCFGCGASGNFVQLVMRLEGLDWYDAVEVIYFLFHQDYMQYMLHDILRLTMYCVLGLYYHRHHNS